MTKQNESKSLQASVDALHAELRATCDSQRDETAQAERQRLNHRPR